MGAQLPTAVKELKGTCRRDRLKNEWQPQPLGKTPPAPRHLSKFAKVVWKSLAPGLRAAGLLTAADLVAFEALCSTYGRWREARSTVDNEGFLTRGSQGQQVRHPAAMLEAEMASRLRQMLREFGLTPASRAAIGVPHEDPLSPLSEFLDSKPVPHQTHREKECESCTTS